MRVGSCRRVALEDTAGALCAGSGAAAWGRPAPLRGTPVAYGGAASRLDSGQCWGYLSRWRRAPRERTKVRRLGRLRACFFVSISHRRQPRRGSAAGRLRPRERRGQYLPLACRAGVAGATGGSTGGLGSSG